MKSIKTSRSKQNHHSVKPRSPSNLPDFQQDEISDRQSSSGSIEFSISFPSQTKRSQSPGLRGKHPCKCGCIELSTTLQILRNQNKLLTDENKHLKSEIQKFKKQNQEILEIKSIASKRLQTKNIECQELKFRVKELLTKVEKIEKQNLNISMSSMKNIEDQDNTLNTICLEKEKITNSDEEISVKFDKKLEDELSKYIEVKMKLDLTIRKLEQKQMLINFLQNQIASNRITQPHHQQQN